MYLLGIHILIYKSDAYGSNQGHRYSPVIWDLQYCHVLSKHQHNMWKMTQVLFHKYAFVICCIQSCKVP